MRFGDKRANQSGSVGGAVKSRDNGGKGGLSRGLRDLYSPQESDEDKARDVVDVLLDMDKISIDQFDQVRQQEKKRPDVDIEKLSHDIGVNNDDLLMAKAELYGLEFHRIKPDDVDRQVFDKLEINYIRSSRAMPIATKNGSLVIATSKPGNIFVIDDIKRRTGMPIEVVVCTFTDIETVCNQFDDSTFNYDVDEIISDLEDIEVVENIEDDMGDIEKIAGESPVIKFVNFLLSNALRENASDIHIEPKEKYTKIRYRIDGMLYDTKEAPSKMHPAIVSRIKIMACLDISERRMPQDGKIAVRMGGRGVDLRVSILPTSHGEKVVIRILDSSSIMRGLGQSGMEQNITEQFRDQITMPHGILLVTGPTGSGKSTTLYSALSEIKSDHLNISTVEDPVEYNLEFCNQVQVREQIGMTFASTLRSLLRQDPDIIMVGEIRDLETARVAVQAALTGHLVLSTLHTNDAPSSISRLVNIGVEPYLIAVSLNAVLAQRLVRRICDNCKEPYVPPDNMKKYINATGIDAKKIRHGKGCDQCRDSGYIGRAGIFELMIADDNMRETINKDSSANGIKKAFIASGQPSLFEDGMAKVEQGITTLQEVLRVTEGFGKDDEQVLTSADMMASAGGKSEKSE